MNNIYKEIILKDGIYESYKMAKINAVFNEGEVEYIEFLKAIDEIYKKVLLDIAEQTGTSVMALNKKIKGEE